MTRLTVLYDANCGLCRRARQWLELQPKFLALEFIPKGSDHARDRFPGLSSGPDELIAVSDDGSVYRGERAWIMCLYALREYREWATRLAAPALLPLARTAFQLISENRVRISRLFRLYTDEGVARELQNWQKAGCPIPLPRPAIAAPAAQTAPRARAANGMREWLE